MASPLKSFLRDKTPLGYLRGLVAFNMAKSQSDEANILDHLASAVSAPRSFVEFGFHIQEFNCIRLAKTWNGMLIDGNAQGIALAKRILPSTVDAQCKFLTLDNLNFVEGLHAPGELGILSIDVDGNDYWFLQRLLAMEPAIISVEYNASMGLRPLTVPYDPTFYRMEKHKSGWYHGASITALDKLCGGRGYDLVAVSNDGINLFFVKASTRPDSLPKLVPSEVYRENAFRNQWSNTRVEQQWEAIKHLLYVEV